MANSTIVVKLFFEKVKLELDLLQEVTKDLATLFWNASQRTTTAPTTTTTENPLAWER